jgi:hypothetical protein
MAMKYIVFEDNYTAAEFVVIFASYIPHDAMARMIAVKGTPVRAGSFSMQEFDCYGQSISLGLKSDPEKDNKLIERDMNSY